MLVLKYLPELILFKLGQEEEFFLLVVDIQGLLEIIPVELEVVQHLREHLFLPQVEVVVVVLTLDQNLEME